MILYIFFVINAMLQAATGYDILGTWSEQGNCGSNDATLVTFTARSVIVDGNSLDWWIKDGMVMIGVRDVGLTLMGMSIETVTDKYMSGKFATYDSDVVSRFVWEKCSSL